jgi:alginate O-acetyltransferase complex protein AlgI
MTFDSLTFALFLAIFFPIYALTRNWCARKNWLVFGSCVFYGSWNPIFLLLLGVTTVFDWWAALRIQSSSDARERKRWMIASVAASLSILGYFKYAQLFANTAIDWLSYIGVSYKPIDLGIVLPLGISFYIFESISYIVDVYKRRVEPTKSLRDYALFMTFFPHLVAGPIMRYRDFEEQIATPRMVTTQTVALGCYLAVGGLFLKIVCADHIFAPVANLVFAPDYKAGFVGAWMGAYAFTMQVFCDFAGYSLTAIGVAMMLGFQLPSNFESPFASVGMAEFMTRWHISLSNWLRDYVFNPLGHYRKGRLRGHVNVLITFTACGFWHGAAWHFVLWGSFLGVVLVVERVLKDRMSTRFDPLWEARLTRASLAFFTYTLFSVSGVFFRAPDLSVVWARLCAMFGFAGERAAPFLWNSQAVLFLIGAITTLCVQAFLKNRKGWQWLPDWSWTLRAAILAFMSIAILLSPGKTAAFIYFQF